MKKAANLLMVSVFILFACANKEQAADIPSPETNSTTEQSGNVPAASRQIVVRPSLGMDEITIFDKNNNTAIKLGDGLDEVVTKYVLLEEKYVDFEKESIPNVTELKCTGIDFMIVNHPRSPDYRQDAETWVKTIAVTGKNRYTDRGVSVGDTKESVLENYGTPDFTRNTLNRVKVREAYTYRNTEYETIQLDVGFDTDGIVNILVLSIGT